MREPIKSIPVITFVRELREEGLDEHDIVVKLLERAVEKERDWNKHCPFCNTRNIIREGGDCESELWKCNKNHLFKVILITRREVA